MKQILFLSAFIFSVFTVSAEFGAWRKAGVKCGTGQNALGCIISGLNDNTLGQKLNCSETYFLGQIAESYNRQAGTSFTAGDARNAFIDGQMFIIDWPANDLMNSVLKAGTAHYFPMTGNREVKVIASKDLSGRTIPLVKAEGTNKDACFNVCYSKSMKPYQEEKNSVPKQTAPTVIDLPAPTPSYAVNLPPPVQQPSQQMIMLDWPSQPVPGNLPVITINPVFPAQPPTVFLPQQQCCGNRGWGNNPPIIAPNPTGNGFPVEGPPNWDGNGTPIDTDPGWGNGPSYNDSPIAGDPGWNGNIPTYWPNGNTGNNGGNTNNGNSNGNGNGPVE